MSDPTKPKLLGALKSALFRQVQNVKERGDKKYGVGSWRQREPEDFLEAMGRHLSAVLGGNRFDEDTGTDHLACIVVNAEYAFETMQDRRRSGRPEDMPLEAVLRLEGVLRWHVVKHSGRQSVAEHTFAVQAIGRRILQLAERRSAIPDFLEVALLHDADEALFGDIPSPAKLQPGPGPELEPGLLEWVLKTADILDAIRFISQHGIGDHAQRVAADLNRAANTWISRRPDLAPAAFRVWEEINQEPMSARDIETESGERT